MKNIVLLGATGGLGSKLLPLLKERYNVIGLGSKDLDVTNLAEVQASLKDTKPDILINLSGYNYDNFLHRYKTGDIEQINKQIDVNIKGSINTVLACLPYMREQNYGRIILASSILAEHPVVSTSIYSGCKGFIDSFVKVVALENASKNINCNSLQLGYFDGGLTHRIPVEFKQEIQNKVPMKRWGQVEELFNTVDYLIRTPYITGQGINISGGIS
jgi:3-oxoacyl-[acyl-carrier protein] reductase